MKRRNETILYQCKWCGYETKNIAAQYTSKCPANPSKKTHVPILETISNETELYWKLKEDIGFTEMIAEIFCYREMMDNLIAYKALGMLEHRISGTKLLRNYNKSEQVESLDFFITENIYDQFSMQLGYQFSSRHESKPITFSVLITDLKNSDSHLRNRILQRIGRISDNKLQIEYNDGSVSVIFPSWQSNLIEIYNNLRTITDQYMNTYNELKASLSLL